MTRVIVVDERTETLVHNITIQRPDDVRKVTKEILQRQEDQPGSLCHLVLVHRGQVKVIKGVEEIPVPAYPSMEVAHAR